MREHKKQGKNNIIIPVIAAVVTVAIVIFGVFRFMQEKNLEKAFNPLQYECFRAVMSQEITDLSGNNDEKNDTRTLDDAYTVIRQSDTYYEKSGNGENYYYSENGENYVMFFDDNYGRNGGKWIKMKNNGSFAPSLDISLLEKIDLNSLSKHGKSYKAVNGTADDGFFTLWQITKKENYSDISLSFSMSGDKIGTITAEYTFEKKQKCKDVYTFSYGNIKLEIPPADETYGG